MLEKIKDYKGGDAWIDLEAVTAIVPWQGTKNAYSIQLVGNLVLVSEETARHVAALCSK